MTNSDVQELAKVSKPTATRLLSSLTRYLELKGTTGKGTYYVVKGLTNGSYNSYSSVVFFAQRIPLKVNSLIIIEFFFARKIPPLKNCRDCDTAVIVPLFGPPFLQKVAAISDSEADADMLILGTRAAISACLPNIYAIYARRELFTNLYLFVTARAGSGKGRLSLCRAIVDPIHEELRAESNKLEMDYREERRRYPGAHAAAHPPSLHSGQ